MLFRSEEDPPIPILQMDPAGEQRQTERLRQLRRERDNREVTRTLHALEAACRENTNVMPPLLDAVRAYATLGETCDVMRNVFGGYLEPVMI